MRIRLWCCATGESSSAEPTTNCWRSAAITPISIRSSFWKQSWNANERFPRRRETRQALRHAADAPADEVFAPVSLAGVLRGGDEPGRGRHGNRGAISFWTRRRSLHFACGARRNGEAGGPYRARSDLSSLSRLIGREFCASISADAHHAVGGSEDDV